MKQDNSVTNNQYSVLWLIAPLLHISLLIFLASTANDLERWVLASFILITAFSSWCLFADRRPYTLNKVWWLFHIVFMGIVPSVQAELHSMPWHKGDITAQTMLRANLLILACLVLYQVVRWRLNSRKRSLQLDISFPELSPHFVDRFRIVAPLLMILCGISLLLVFGWKGLLLRGHMEAAALHYNTTFQLLFDKCMRGIMLYLALAGIWLYRKNHIPKSWLIPLLALAFLLNFPLALPRYLAFTIYMSWLLAAGFSWMQRRHVFTLGVLGLLLLMGPLVSLTRYAGIDMQERFSDPAEVFRKAYLVSDFDAYSSLCRIMQYVSQQGNTAGHQLTGVLFFFVPRSVWPTKPVGSGAFLFTELGFEFKNVSCTYLAEGYINFGWVGSMLFAIIIAVCISAYDRFYWRKDGVAHRFLYARLFYLISLGMLFFLLRGDLMSSFAYTTGLFVTGWFLHRLLLAEPLRKGRH